MPTKNHRSDVANRSDFAPYLSMICTISVLGWILWYCRYGFDFADEGFYFVSISEPEKYGATVSQFGFIYHPLYTLLHGDISILRQANVFITFLLAWILSKLILQSFLEKKALDRLASYVISAAFATTSLAFLRLWLPSPSYNWLAFQAILISLIGLILIDKISKKRSAAGCILLGLGGWLAFMAKPTTAAALALFSILYLIASGKFSARIFITSLLFTLAFIFSSAFIIDGSIIKFIERLRDGLKLSDLLDAGHNISDIFRFGDFYFSANGKNTLVLITIIFFLATYFTISGKKILKYIGDFLTILFSLLILAASFGYYRETFYAGNPFQIFTLSSIPLAMFLIGVLIYRFEGFQKIKRPQWALALMLLVSPYAFAFGTGNNYWYMGGLVGIFWVLAGFVFLGPIVVPNRTLAALLLPLGFAAQLLAVVQVLNGMERPYDQPQPLRQDNYEVALRNKTVKLKIAHSFGQYITSAIDVANQADFKQGTPMIDLTGHSPGVLFALDASNTGQAWLYGNFPNKSGDRGGDKVAAKVLGEAPCEEVSRAWLLAEPKGPVSLSPNVLSSFGASLDTDYKVVGTFKTAAYVSGFPNIQMQEILKPTRAPDVSMHACAASRASHS